MNISTYTDMLMEVFSLVDVDKVFKALGDPIRIRIVEMLSENGEMCVCEIMEKLDMTQSAVSHHLAAMKNAGLATSRREGQWIHYSLCREVLSEVCLVFLNKTLEKLDSAASDHVGCCA